LSGARFLSREWSNRVEKNLTCRRPLTQNFHGKSLVKTNLIERDLHRGPYAQQHDTQLAYQQAWKSQ